MKKLMVLMCVFGLSLQAKAISAADFTASFVQQVNENIKFENEQRAAAGKKLYCEQLDERQIALIAKVASIPEINVADFVAKVSDELECYKPFWPDWGHKDNLGGIALNSKAFALDTILIRESMESLVGHEPYEYEPILELINE